jgi:4-hydroxy-3-methylbut-2-enyl diphosphate reductase
MRVLIAQTAGFCMGVRRAVDLAVDHSSGGSRRIYTLGPLIHNRQTVDMLRDRGVETLDEKIPPEPGSTVLIRAHGVPPDKRQHYEHSGHPIIDGTCPKVTTVHKVIRRYRDQGYAIVVTGDEGHAEVVGLMGYAGDAGHRIQSPEEVAGLPDLPKVCLVSQTTFDRETFDEIAQRVGERYADREVVVRKTICSATDRRQKETRELASRVDAMIVVGGKHSANTLRLANISRKHAPITQHIETEQEIEWEPLAGCETVGITAGASTPNWLINRVAEHLKFLDQTRKTTLGNACRRLFDLLTNLNLIVAAGGVAMYYASCYLQGFPFTPTGAALTFLYLVSMYLWNSLTSMDLTRHLGISRYRFYDAHKPWLMVMTVGCIGLLLLISLAHSGLLFWVMLVPTLAGSVYHFSIVPRPLRRFIPYSNLKDIPTSRDLFVALAWAVLITAIPHAIREEIRFTPSAGLFFVWTFFLAFLRSLIFDLRDIEGDRIMGRETLVTIIGERRVRKTIYSILVFSLIVLGGFAALYLVPGYPWPESHTRAFLLQIPVVVYLWGFMQAGERITRTRSRLFNLLADGQFFLAGLGAWAAQMIGI